MAFASVTQLLIGVALILAGGLAGSLARSAEQRGRLAAVGMVAGCALGLGAALPVLVGSGALAFESSWDLPGASLNLAVDALTAWFLLPLLIVVPLTAVYGTAYRGANGHPAGRWFFFALLPASIVIVLTARNALLFLIAWEVMSVSAFILIATDDEQREVRRGARVFLIAAHLGTAFLLVMFLLLGRDAGSLEFDAMSAAGRAGAIAMTAPIFLLGLVGFGTKAGLFPAHAWLPEAHPAAPSHVSALLSGVLISTGIYGILRLLSILGAPAEWWGGLLIGVGALSAVTGVLFALAQHDLKKLLAYSSVENQGLIALALGVGVLGQATGSTTIAFLGFAGAILHAMNHALFKSLLFLGAGAVLSTTGERRIDLLGGLLKRMPWTGTAFLAGAAAIACLPPLNGLVGEYLIFTGAMRAASGADISVAVGGLVALTAVAAVAGMVAFAFVKASGMVFLGAARSDSAASAREVPRRMAGTMLALAALCLAAAAAAPFVHGPLTAVVALITGSTAAEITKDAAVALDPLRWLLVAGWGFLGGAVLLYLLRALILRRRSVQHAVTWDCGYAAPSSRMQYTGSSFAEPATTLFRVLLLGRRRLRPPTGLFPQGAHLETTQPDTASGFIWSPLMNWIERVSGPVRRLQSGRINLYLLYVVLTLLVLFAWNLMIG